ncbi:YdeI family protein [Mucilaginibacter koreensis]
MEATNVKTDEYIAKAADFAKPILMHIRALVHRACPQIEEKIKWGHVHYDYKGPVCHMAAFKQHCAMGFWKQSLMPDLHGLFAKEKEAAMGSMGRITTLADLPPDEYIIAYIHEAVKLNEQDIKAVRKSSPKPEIPVPPYVTEALELNSAAKQTFENFSAACRREYLEWITEAKTEATRQKRLTQAVEWMAEGKDRNWKYK